MASVASHTPVRVWSGGGGAKPCVRVVMVVGGRVCDV